MRADKAGARTKRARRAKVGQHFSPQRRRAPKNAAFMRNLGRYAPENRLKPEER